MNERQGLDGTKSRGDDLIARDVNGREEIALRLTLEAMRNSQRAVVGLLALPASIALGVAAAVSYTAAFVERGFQTFETSLARIARDAEILGNHREERPLFGAGSTESSEQLTKSARS